jgi:hypothetical protein
VGSIVAGIASIAGGLIGGNSAKKASKYQANAANAATAEQGRQFDTIQQQQSPFRDAGVKALNQLMQLYGMGEGGTGQPDYSAFQNSPDYQFALQQGGQAVDRSAAARGNLNSGNTLAAQQQFGQGLASQQLGNYRNQLMGLIGGGQNAGNVLAQAGLQTGQMVGNNLMAAGNARGSGALASGISLGQGLGEAASAIAPQINQWWQNRGLSPVVPGRPQLGP